MYFSSTIQRNATKRSIARDAMISSIPKIVQTAENHGFSETAETAIIVLGVITRSENPTIYSINQFPKKAMKLR